MNFPALTFTTGYLNRAHHLHLLPQPLCHLNPLLPISTPSIAHHLHPFDLDRPTKPLLPGAQVHTKFMHTTITLLKTLYLLLTQNPSQFALNVHQDRWADGTSQYGINVTNAPVSFSTWPHHFLLSGSINLLSLRFPSASHPPPTYNFIQYIVWQHPRCFSFLSGQSQGFPLPLSPTVSCFQAQSTCYPWDPHLHLIYCPLTISFSMLSGSITSPMFQLLIRSISGFSFFTQPQHFLLSGSINLSLRSPSTSHPPPTYNFIQYIVQQWPWWDLCSHFIAPCYTPLIFSHSFSLCAV